MATDPALPIQIALVSEIKALATAAGNNVFDRVPASDPFPRVTIGSADAIPEIADCYDGTEFFQTIDVWSRAVGYPEAKEIADAIRDRLHQGDLTVAGHIVDLLEIESINYRRDPDGLTSRAIILVRIESQPAAVVSGT